jgi:hypothetical protein
MNWGLRRILVGVAVLVVLVLVGSGVFLAASGASFAASGATFAQAVQDAVVGVFQDQGPRPALEAGEAFLGQLKASDYRGAYDRGTPEVTR